MIDGRPFDNVDSLRVHSATDYVGKEYIIRWTELLFVSYGGSESEGGADPAELSRLAEHLAQAFCLAVTPYLEPLAVEMLMKIGLRVTVGSDQVHHLTFLKHAKCGKASNKCLKCPIMKKITAEVRGRSSCKDESSDNCQNFVGTAQSRYSFQSWTVTNGGAQLPTVENHVQQTIKDDDDDL